MVKSEKYFSYFLTKKQGFMFQYCKYDKFKPWIVSVFLLPAIIFLIFNRGEFIFVDYVNLLIHEGGHGIFRFFGKFIYTLGGSLMQLLIPSMFVGYYLIYRQTTASQISLIWLGENFFNVGKYISDAKAMKLPLLGGSKVYHDWNYLLRNLDLLKYDTVFGNIVFVIGTFCFLIAILIPLVLKKTQNIDIELNL